MIEEKTVFILGAGASVPYGYPTGEKLRAYICSSFISYFNQLCDHLITASSRNIWFKKVKNFAESFKGSTNESIDLFLARNDKFSDIGKLAIVLSIFHYEKRSKFREDIDNAYRVQDWYRYLFRRMTNTLLSPDSYKDFRQNDVTFITFNYDRSLEYFFYESLSNSFGITTDDEIVEIMRKLRIYHVYGKICHLPWEGDSTNSVDYMKDGDDELFQKYNFEFIDNLKDNIRVMHERTDHDLTEMINHIAHAKRIFFLGFGYAQENLEILNICKNIHPDHQIYGTAFGYLAKEIEDIRSVLRTSLKPKISDSGNPRIRDMDCVTLLREFL